jgi:hypothetical protein
MRVTRTQSCRIGIAIRVNQRCRPLLARAGIANAKASLKRYVDGAIADLGLADFATPEVVFEERAPSRHSVEFDVVINDTPCRIPSSFPSNGASPVARAALIRRIERVIHLNRELLINTSLADAYRESRSSKQGGGDLRWLSSVSFRDYLRLLTRACQRLDRGNFADDPAQLPIARWTAEACFEHAVESLACLQCAVLRPPGVPMTNAADEETLDRLLSDMRDDLYRELGVRIPNIELRAEAELKQTEFRVQINDLRLPPVAGLAESEYLASGEPEDLRRLGMESEAATNPETGANAAIARDGAEGAKHARSAGLTVWGRGGYLTLVCKGELRRHAAAYITTEAVQYDLDLLNDFCGDVIARAKRRFGVPMIAQVMRSLIGEGINIPDMAGVLEAMLAIKSTLDVDFERYIILSPYTAAPCPAVFGKRLEEVGSDGYAECVRAQFNKYISLKYSAGKGTLNVLRLDPEIEDRVARAALDPLTEEGRAGILDAIHRAWAKLTLVGPVPPVVLTNPEVRKPFRQLIEVEFPDLAVLSYLEAHLPPQVIGTISLQPGSPPHAPDQ